MPLITLKTCTILLKTNKQTSNSPESHPGALVLKKSKDKRKKGEKKDIMYGSRIGPKQERKKKNWKKKIIFVKRNFVFKCNILRF